MRTCGRPSITVVATAFVALAGGCGAPEAQPVTTPRDDEPPAPRASMEPPAEGASIEPRAEAAPAEEPPRADEPEPATTGSVVCAFVRIGIDSRALPTSASPEQRELFVRGEASDLTAAAAPGPTLDVRTWPGTGVVEARFGAESDAAAVQRCEDAVRRYLADAPRLPRTDDRAAAITDPCAPSPCERD